MATINGPPQESIPSDDSMAAGPQAHRNTEAHRGKDLFNALVPVKAWMQDKQLRSPIVGLLVLLVAVPAIGTTIHNLTAGAWVFAGFFAVAWLLLLFVIVRPQNITAGPLALVAVLGLIIEFPMTLWLENIEISGGGPGNILAWVFEVGVPEELSKMVPVLVVAAVVLFGKPKESWLALKPRDYLFLGAVCGAVFGASEAVNYVITHLPSLIQQNGGLSIANVQQVVMQFGTWRFLTDPASHAMWAGIAGYFVGLAIQEYHKGMIKQAAIAIGCIGVAITSVLHGFNDWVASPAGFFFVLVNVVSVLLFLGYARVGASPDALQAAVQAPLKVEEETS